MNLAEKVYLHSLNIKNASEYASKQAGAITNLGKFLSSKGMSTGNKLSKLTKDGKNAIDKMLDGTKASIDKNKMSLFGPNNQGVVSKYSNKVDKKIQKILDALADKYKGN